MTEPGAGAQPTEGTTLPPPDASATTHHAEPPPTRRDPDPPADPASGGGQPSQDGDTVLVHRSAFKKIKDEARQKGTRDGQSQVLKDLGFDSVDAVKAALKRKHRRAATKTDDSPPADDPADTSATDAATDSADVKQLRREIRRMQRHVRQLEKRNADLTKEARSGKNRARNLKIERDALQAEMEVRQAAALAGVKDIDYGMAVLVKKLSTMSEDEAKEFDANKYFGGEFKKAYPYLFGETTQPVTTGSGTDAPTAPNPGAANQANGAGSKVDATKMKTEEFQEHLRSRGLSLQV